MNMQQRVISQLEKLAALGPEQSEAVIQSPPQTGYIVGVPAEGKGAGASLGLEDFDRFSIILKTSLGR